MDDLFLSEEFEEVKTVGFHLLIILTGQDAPACLFVRKGMKHQQGSLIAHLDEPAS